MFSSVPLYFLFLDIPYDLLFTSGDLDPETEQRIALQQAEEEAREASVHEQSDGTLLALCMTGTNSKASLKCWIRHLIKTNPDLANTPVLFRLRTPDEGVRGMQGDAHFEFVTAEKEMEDKLLEDGRTWQLYGGQGQEGKLELQRQSKFPVIVTNSMKRVVPETTETNPK